VESEFLKTQWDVLTAADFFTVDAWTCHGLTRFAVLFVIDLSTRRIHIAGTLTGRRGLRVDGVSALHQRRRPGRRDTGSTESAEGQDANWRQIRITT